MSEPYFGTIDQFIAEYTENGWQIVSRTDNAVQMRKPKQWSQAGIIVGLVGLIFGGIGIIFLIITALDYAFQREQIIYVSTADLKAGRLPVVKDKGEEGRKLASQAVIFLIILAILFAIALRLIVG